MKKVCVFTGAASGINTLYKDAAYQMGQMLASRGLGLVYGGGKLGLMGAVADGVLAANGNVTGCLLYTSPSPRDYAASRMPSSA